MGAKGCARLLVTTALLSWYGVVCVVLDGNAYKDLVVSLSSNIRSEDRRSVLTSTKELIATTSSVLYKAIGLRIGEVTFYLPHSWGPSEAWADHAVPSATRWQKNHMADIQLENVRESVFGKSPFALQGGGCGVAGQRITIPTNFVLDNEQDDNRKARLLSREWLKYRYGVFDEQGFNDDPRYPLYFRVPGAKYTEVEVTDCSNEPVFYRYLDSDGNNCTLTVNEDTGLPTDSGCAVQADPDDNENVTSSLMYLQFLPNVEHLCGDEMHPHNSRRPNKQNALCNGRSVWDILREHQDFKDKDVPIGGDQADLPSFRYVQEKTSRMVIAMDINKGIAAETRKLVNEAAARFLYELPPSTQLGFVKFSQSATTNPLWPEVQQLEVTKMRDIFLYVSNWKKEEESCPVCALEKATQMLASDDSSHGTIILITSKDPPPEDSATLWDDPRSQEFCLEVIILPGATAQGYEKLVEKAVCGSVTQLQENEKLSQLFKIFESIVQKDIPNRDKIKLKTTGNLNKDAEVTFNVDSTADYFTMWLSNLEGEKVDIDESEVVVFPVGSPDALVNRTVQQSGFFLDLIIPASPGEWKYKISEPMPLRVDVTTIPKNTWKPLQVRIWTRFTTATEELERATQQPLVLCAEVSLGADPIFDARVQAKVTPSMEGSTPIEFQLLDNGLGDPDVTKNDGIYSRYFTQFTTGEKYHILITVTDDDGKAKVAKAIDEGSCCGSLLRTSDEATTTVGFFREAEMYFSTTGQRPEIGYGPSRILDLRVVSVTKPNLFTFQWTAPGGELDHGAASKYIFKMFERQEDAFTSFDSDKEIVDGFQLEEDITPAPYGNVQKATIDVSTAKADNQSYFFAMRAFSQSGRAGKVSNIVEIFVPSILDISTTISDDIVTKSNNSDGIASGQSAGTSGKTIGMIVGILIFVILIIVGVYGAVYIFHIKPKRVRQKTVAKGRTAAKDSEAAKEEPLRLNNTNDGTVPASEWQLDRDPISPVNSVPANVLLYHHEQVKEAKKKHLDPPLFKLENLQGSGRETNPEVLENGIKHISTNQGSRPTFEKQPTDSNDNLQENSEDSSTTNSRPNSEELYTKSPRRTTNV